MYRIILFVAVVLGAVACRPVAEERMLDEAEELLADRPDSALHLLLGYERGRDGYERLDARHANLCNRALVAMPDGQPCDTLADAACAFYKSSSRKSELIESAYAFYFKGLDFYGAGELSDALSFYLEADYRLSRTAEMDLRGDLMMAMGRLYRKQQYVNLSSAHFAKAVTCYERTNKKRNAIYAMMAAGSEYYRISDMKYYNSYCKHAEQYALELQDTAALMNLARIYATEEVDNGRYEAALHRLQEAVARYAHGVTPEAYYYLLGRIYLYLGDADTSADYLAMRLSDTSEQKRQEALYDLSSGHWKLENERVAGELFATVEEYQKAYHRQQRALAVYDSLYYAEKRSLIPGMQGRFFRDMLLEKNEQLRHRVLYQWGAGVLLFLVIILLVLWLLSRRRSLILLQRQTIAEYRATILRLKDAYTAERGKPRIGLPQELIDRRVDFMRKLLDTAVLYGGRSELFSRKMNELISAESEGGVQWIFEDILNMQQPGVVKFLRSRYPQLSEREVCLYCMICLDMSKSAICMVANISAKTYYNQRNILRGKLALTNHDVTFTDHFEALCRDCAAQNEPSGDKEQA